MRQLTRSSNDQISMGQLPEAATTRLYGTIDQEQQQQASVRKLTTSSNDQINIRQVPEAVKTRNQGQFTTDSNHGISRNANTKN